MNRQEVAALRAELRSPEVAAEVASRARSPEVGVGPELQASAACVRPVCIVLGLVSLSFQCHKQPSFLLHKAGCCLCCA